MIHSGLTPIEIDLPLLAAEAMRAFSASASSRGTELLLDVGPEVPHDVIGDPVVLRQVLSSLLSNAVRFTEAGEITVAMRSPSRTAETVVVSLAVEDTGVGIPLERREVIFEGLCEGDTSDMGPYRGGLGLALSRRLVGLMGGALAVQSEVGKGTRFSFDIALGVGAAGADAATANARLQGRRVLLIDDNASARRITRSIVEAAGADVEEAEEGTRGLQAIREGAESSRGYDVVLVDALMPDVDGFAIAEAVRSLASPCRPRTLVLTPAASEDEAARARALGVGGLLEKPLSGRRLLRAIGLLLNSTRGEEPERRLVTGGTLDHLRARGRILFADDSKVNQHVLVSMLRKYGYVVDVVDNGSKAVDALQAGSYDLVLMDVEMPVMGGIEATRMIRRTRAAADLPIVAVTAHSWDDEKERILEAGMNDFLAKPFSAESLWAVLERWCVRTQRATVRGPTREAP